MKKILAILLIVSAVPAVLLPGLSKFEYEQYDKLIRFRYPNFIYQSGIATKCELTPRGWIGKYDAQTACDILHNQFSTIDEYVKKTLETDKDVKSFSDFAQDRNNNFIKEKEVGSLVETILLDSNKEQQSNEAKLLMNKYQTYFGTSVENELRKKALHILSKKYPH